MGIQFSAGAPPAFEDGQGARATATLARQRETAKDHSALYVYCIVPGVQEVNFGPVGLDGSEVRSVPGVRISGLVHVCPARPYQSKDSAVVEDWVSTHHQVVEEAWSRFGSVLPMSFDMIISAGHAVTARENLVNWMYEKREPFARQLEQLAGQAEYGVQISWDPKLVAEDILQSDPDLRRREGEIEAKPKGLGYIGRARLQKTIKQKMEERAEEYFQAFYGRVRDCVQDVRVDQPKKTDDGTQMLLNVSCLVEKGDHRRLGELLDQIAGMNGVSVHFTGPWPPYSFAVAG